MARSTRILGLDPGTRVVGYGLVEAEGTRLKLLEAGVLKAARKDPLERRLATLSTGLRGLLAKFAPDSAAVEDVFVKSDPRAALAVGHGRGAILAALGESGIAVSSYAPASIKRAVAGNGMAAKEQVAKMIGILLGPGPDLPLDATDALAAAVAHALALRTQAIENR
ncbi:MAG: crossover junction endodeoxyribonuclease RuvC [Planctomycetota bacterium]